MKRASPLSITEQNADPNFNGDNVKTVLTELEERNARLAVRAKNIKLTLVSVGLTGIVIVAIYWEDITHFFRQ